MSVITISRGSYGYGKEVAEKVAKKLGFKCIGREVILEASKVFNIPEIKLTKAIEEAPSLLDRITYGKEKYIAYIRAMVLRHLKEDNVVYHGFAGHYFVKDVSHVLKVRVIADINKRAELVMKKENVGFEEAVKIIEKLDSIRKRWSTMLYGIDTHDPNLYDMVINIDKLTSDDATEIICYSINELERFKTTPESQKIMEELALAAEVKAKIVDIAPFAEVTASEGLVKVKVEVPLSQEEKIIKEIREKARQVPEVTQVIVESKILDAFTD